MSASGPAVAADPSSSFSTPLPTAVSAAAALAVTPTAHLSSSATSSSATTSVPSLLSAATASPLASIDQRIADVEADIKRVEVKIEKAEQKLDTCEEKDKQYWMSEKSDLRKEKEQLRDEKKLLLLQQQQGMGTRRSAGVNEPHVQRVAHTALTFCRCCVFLSATLPPHTGEWEQNKDHRMSLVLHRACPHLTLLFCPVSPFNLFLLSVGPLHCRSSWQQEVCVHLLLPAH